MTSTSPQANSTSRSTKVRIYELSRKLGKENKDILDACEALGISAKSHSSSIGMEDADKICKHLNVDPASIDFSSSRKEPKETKDTGSSSDASGGLQILEVRKASADETPAEASAAPPPSAPPKQPAAPKASSPTTPKAVPAAPKAPAPPSAPANKAVASPPAVQKPAPAAAQPSSPAASKPAQKPSVPNPPQAPQLKRPVTSPPPKQPARQVASKIEREPATPAKAPTTPAKRPPQIVQPPTAPKPAAAVSQPAASKPAAPKPPAQNQPPRKMVAKPIAPASRGPQKSAPDSAPATGERPRVSERPKPSAPKKPQLVGAPTRPGVKARIAQPTRDRANDSDRPAPPKKDVPQLVGPPTRAKAKGPGGDSISVAGEAAVAVPELAAAPKRPTNRALPKRKQSPSREDDELAALKQPTKKRGKRRRGGSKDEDSFENDAAMLSAAQQSELDALKPLPRPGAKPPTSGPRLTPVRTTSRPKSSRPSRRQQQAAAAAAVEAAEAEKPTLLELEGSLTVQELANKLQIAETEIIKALFLKGVMANINQTLDIPTAEMVATELGYDVEHKEAAAAATKTEMLDITDVEHLTHRPPVVTIMGHVDHGKTTLLDSIRETKVASGEAGGITQHIGAYHVDLDTDSEETKRVVFLDTPGHEAFTAMRARGTKVTDIAILVVAADDGVRPQTLEAISHAQAAQVPIVVAINKIDKEGSSPDRVKQELAERGLVSEDWGGDIPMVGVSALAKQNLDELLEMLLLVAEVGELQANPDRPAKGTVIEANLDKARGPVATLLVQNGTLRVGDTLVAGSVMGRVKAMVDDRGVRVQEAGPSSAVEVLGMNDVPAAGDEFDVYTDDKEARQVAEDRAAVQRQSRLQQAMASRRVSLGTLSAQAQEGELKELNLILKADVQGSVEAILGSLQQLSQDEVQIRVLLASPGEVSETDIDLAAASNAIIIGFNTTLAPGARAAADRYGVDIREYDIIYNLLEEITAAMEGLLEPEEVEEWLGQVEVRMLIQIGKGVVAGSYVQSGKVLRNAFVRVTREGNKLYEGRIDSLKRFKEDVREVASGFECGIALDNFNDWKEGDVLEVYQLVAKRRTLASASK